MKIQTRVVNDRFYYCHIISARKQSSRPQQTPACWSSTATILCLPVMSLASRCFRIVPTTTPVFYDMAPLLADPALRREVTARLAEQVRPWGATLVLALETRGYWPGAWLAEALGVPLVALRKTANARKSGAELVTQAFDLEYKQGESIALPIGSIPPHARVVLVDDVLATGGTLAAAVSLVPRVEPTATVVGIAVLLELLHLQGAKRLTGLGIATVALTRGGNEGVYDLPKSIRITPLGIRASDRRAVLMWHPAMRELAETLLNAMNDYIRPSEIAWAAFPDGWPNVHFEHRDTLEDRDVVFLASFHDPALLFEQISMLIALPRQLIRSLRVACVGWECRSGSSPRQGKRLRA